jgi:protein-tyrosine phosphatase
VLDAQAPTDAQLEQALAFIDEHRRGRVFVHCALGRSRSATVVAAWLLSRGHERSVEAIEAELAGRRAGVAFTPPQAARLRAWTASRAGDAPAAHHAP